MRVCFECRLNKALRTVARTEVIDTEARFFHRQLHDPIADNVNVVPDNTDNDSIVSQRRRKVLPFGNVLIKPSVW